MAARLELCCVAKACMQLYWKTSKSKRSARCSWRIWSYHPHVVSKCTSFSVSPLHRGHRNIAAFSPMYRRLCVSIWLIPSLNLLKASLIWWLCFTSRYFFPKAFFKVLYTLYLSLVPRSLECQFWMEQSLRRCWNLAKKRVLSPSDPFHQAKANYLYIVSLVGPVFFTFLCHVFRHSVRHFHIPAPEKFILKYFTHLVDARTDRWCLPSSP